MIEFGGVVSDSIFNFFLYFLHSNINILYQEVVHQQHPTTSNDVSMQCISQCVQMFSAEQNV